MAMNDIGALIFPNDASSSWPVTYNVEIIIWDDQFVSIISLRGKDSDSVILMLTYLAI